MTRRPHLTQAQCDRAKRLSQVHGRITVAALLGVAPTTVAAVERRGWLAVGGAKRPIPNDWGIVAPGRTIPALAQHYHTSQSIIVRWRREKPVEMPFNGGRAWTPPSDFEDLLFQHSAKRVAEMLGVHEHTVFAARIRLGIHPRQVAARRSIGWADRFTAERRATPSTGAVA